jgi:hypothetical protein
VQSTLKETLTDCLNQPEQIKEFVYMINETETKMEKTFVESFAMLFYRFIECLIVRKLIDCSKQVGFGTGLSFSGFETMVSKYYIILLFYFYFIFISFYPLGFNRLLVLIFFF